MFSRAQASDFIVALIFICPALFFHSAYLDTFNHRHDPGKGLSIDNFPLYMGHRRRELVRFSRQYQRLSSLANQRCRIVLWLTLRLYQCSVDSGGRYSPWSRSVIGCLRRGEACQNLIAKLELSCADRAVSFQVP